MSNSPKRAKKRRLSDSDSSFNSPQSNKRQKVSHPTNKMNKQNNASINNKMHKHINNDNNNNDDDQKESFSSHNRESLLFSNNDTTSTHNDNELHTINSNHTISTPLNFNLSQPEIMRILMQFLENCGYGQSAKCLSKESGIKQTTSHNDNISELILDGNWEKLMHFYDDFAVSNSKNIHWLQSKSKQHSSSYYITPQNSFYSKVLILEQKFLELIFQNARNLAMDVMNKELLPLIAPNCGQTFDIQCNDNLNDIALLSQLTNNQKLYGITQQIKLRNIPRIEMEINASTVYPKWRWNKLCKLLYINNREEIEIEFDELNWRNLNDSRKALCNELILRLIPKQTILPNNALLKIFDEFIKSQLLQSNHFNLRSNRILLTQHSNDTNNDTHNSMASHIPSQTHYILNGHKDEITHLSFSNDGKWLISSSLDKHTLIWDFGNVFLSKPPLSNKQRLNAEEDPINIICDILHYQSVTYSTLSSNKRYLLTITQHQPSLDDFEHDKDAKYYVRRDVAIQQQQYEYPTTAQFKYTHFDECHKKYYDETSNEQNDGNMDEHKEEIMMDTERGCNIYLWQLNESENENNLQCVLLRQLHHYRIEASVCWCPDNLYFFVTAHGCNIDLYQVSNGQIVCTLPSNGNLFSDLKLTHHGYRLCVTMNSRDVRVYITDFSAYYHSLRKYHKEKRKKKSLKKFIPWRHFTHKNYVNLFQQNISNYINKCLYSKNGKKSQIHSCYDDFVQISKANKHKMSSHNDYNLNDIDYDSQSSFCSSSSSSSSSLLLSSSDKLRNGHLFGSVYHNMDGSKSMLSETESLESIDDKIWMHYEENMDLDKKSNGQLKNDCIVSTALSYGGEHEYLLVMVHEFSINGDVSIKHPIILMIDLRNINVNINYNNADIDNNHRNLFDIKFFYGFKQNRFKIQCGFGGFQLPPLCEKAQIYQTNKYEYTQWLKEKKSAKNAYLRHKKQKKMRHKFIKSPTTVTSNGHFCDDLNDKGTKYKKKSVNVNVLRGREMANDECKIDASLLHNNELRNLQIPFFQSLQCEDLSNLQCHINEKVHYHYHHYTLSKEINPIKHKKIKKIKSENKENKDPKSEISASEMIEECVEMSLKNPHFLPSKLLQDIGYNSSKEMNDFYKYEPMIRCLFKSLPLNALQKIYSFIKIKTKNQINIDHDTNDDDDKKMNENESSQCMEKREILQQEIWNAFKGKKRMENETNGNNKHGDYEQLDSSSSTAISSGSLNSLSQSLNHRYLSSQSASNSDNSFIHHNNFDDARYHTNNLKKRCFLLKEKREKLTEIHQKNDGHNGNGKEDKNAKYYLSNEGRSHYLFHKYIRSQIVNDDSDLQYFCNEIDELLSLYNDDNDSEQWAHLSMEIKYFLWHKHLKQAHFNKLREEHRLKISKKKKKKKLKKLKNVSIESKIRSSIKRKKNKMSIKNQNKFCAFLEKTNYKKTKSKMMIRKRRRMDKSRRSNEDISMSPKSANDESHKNEKKNVVNNDILRLDEDKNVNDKSSNDESWDFSSDDDSDINEYVAKKNANFQNDEMNQANIDLFDGCHKNESLHKLSLKEMKSISDILQNKKRQIIKNPIVQNEESMHSENESLIQDEYVSNDFFGGHHFVVSGSEDGNVCIWNRITQKIIKLAGHSKAVNCVAWNPVDSFILVSGSDDHQIRVWGPSQ